MIRQVNIPKSNKIVHMINIFSSLHYLLSPFTWLIWRHLVQSWNQSKMQMETLPLDSSTIMPCVSRRQNERDASNYLIWTIEKEEEEEEGGKTPISSTEKMQAVAQYIFSCFCSSYSVLVECVVHQGRRQSRDHEMTNKNKKKSQAKEEKKEELICCSSSFNLSLRSKTLLFFFFSTWYTLK